MKRRIWAVISLVVVFALLVAGCGQSMPTTASKGQTVELKFAHIMSPQHIQHTQVMDPFAKEVEKVTEGRVKVTIYPGAALAKSADQFNAAVTGIADIAYGVQGYTPGKFPLTSVITLPFQASTAQNATDILWSLYQKFPEMQKEYNGTKVLWLWGGDLGQIITAKKQIKTLDDLKGLKLRSPDPQLNPVLQAWGATPVSMPMPDLYDAMQKGVVDGALSPLSAVNDFNLADVTKYITIANIYSTPFFVVANPASWARISPDDQKKIEGLIGKKMADKATKAWDVSVQEGLKKSKDKGVTIYTLPPDELAKWKAAVESVGQNWVKDMESKGLPGQKVFDEAKSMLKK